MLARSIFILSLLFQPALAAVHHVDSGVSGGINDGTTWATAFPNLDDALSVATFGDTILLAEGAYSPQSDESGNTNPTDPRSKTFFINKDLTILGGHNVIDGVLDTRDVDRYPTVLLGAEGNSFDPSDNIRHILTLEGVTNACRLDGLWISEGYADGSGTDRYGAAAYLRATGLATSPTFANCRFTDNTSVLGAVYIDVCFNDDSTKFLNCIFRNNTGGAFRSQIEGITTQDLLFENCVFSENDGAGNAIIDVFAFAASFADCNVTFANSTIAGNTTSNAAIRIGARAGASVTLTGRNSVFYNNVTSSSPAQPAEIFPYVLIGTGEPTNNDITIDLDYCFLGETDCAVMARPAIVDATVSCGPNMWFDVDPGFDPDSSDPLPSPASPLINTGSTGDAPDSDLLGQARPLNGGIDIGAYEFPGGGTPELSLRINAGGQPVLRWTCLPGETFRIQRSTSTSVINFSNFRQGWPEGGANGWVQEFVETETGPEFNSPLFYRVIRE